MNSSRNPYRLVTPESKDHAKKTFHWWPIPVIVLCVAFLAGAYIYADAQISGYDDFNAMRDTVEGNIIHGPVFIDGTSVTGMTLDEARQMLTHQEQVTAQSFEVELASGDYRWRISSDDVPMEWNTESLLQKAYMIGRMGSLEQRHAQISSLTTPVELFSEFTYDRESVRALTDDIATRLTVQPVNAAVVAFDASNRTFAYSESTPGQTVDAQSLYETVIDSLDNGKYGSTIDVNVQPVEPGVTRAKLESDYMLLSSYTTKTTDDDNRNTNIDLASQAINGKMIPAGGTFSFNETTGQRTTEKGYKEAGAIENGRTVQEVGGGICQVSSTLFNALVRANCEIVSRKPHAWPSDYVPKGEDATVDWPNLDLVMRNASEAPMFIIANYENQTMTVEVYGLSLGKGVSIELESDITYEKTPTEVLYTYNAKLPVGTQPQLLRKARTGYSVQTYKIWKQDGTEVSREKFYNSEYRVINEEYEYNDGNPPPEPTATP